LFLFAGLFRLILLFFLVALRGYRFANALHAFGSGVAGFFRSIGGRSLAFFVPAAVALPAFFAPSHPA
jgi:hypothetical protein